MSLILGTACLCLMDMNAEPAGRHRAGPMMLARLVAVDAAAEDDMPDTPLNPLLAPWQICRNIAHMEIIVA